MPVSRVLCRSALSLAALVAIAPLAASTGIASADELSGFLATERPITANIDAIPEVKAVKVSKPYALVWQQALLAQQDLYVAQMQSAEIDPVETGAISY